MVARTGRNASRAGSACQLTDSTKNGEGEVKALARLVRWGGTS